jgi:hypothetical protein
MGLRARLVVLRAGEHHSKQVSFNMGWWGFTFPIGVFAVSTCTLAKDIPSLFFKVLGTIFSVAVILLWLVVALATLRGVIAGSIFFAPCVSQYEQQLGQAQRQQEKQARRLGFRRAQKKEEDEKQEV